MLEMEAQMGDEGHPHLDGLVAVVTGSTRGLGEAIARDLSSRGARVIVNGTNEERCEALARELGAISVPGSVADEAVATRLADAAMDAYGRLDLLVNNAGMTRDAMVGRMSAEDFDAVVAVHLRGGFLATKAAAAAMRAGTGGSVVNVVSGTALYGHVGQANYAAAKGGMLSLTRSLSLELARFDIRVNAISPIAATDMIEPLFDFAGDRVDLRPLFGTPAQVAGLVAYLASPAAASLTGQVLGFDGTRLSVWSHPTVLRREEREDWTLKDFDAALGDGELARLHPDELGVALQRLLGLPQAP